MQIRHEVSQLRCRARGGLQRWRSRACSGAAKARRREWTRTARYRSGPAPSCTDCQSLPAPLPKRTTRNPSPWAASSRRRPTNASTLFRSLFRLPKISSTTKALKDDPMFSIVNDAVCCNLLIHGDPQHTDPLGDDPDPSLEPDESSPERPVPRSTWLHARTPSSDGASSLEMRKIVASIPDAQRMASDTVQIAQGRRAPDRHLRARRRDIRCSRLGIRDPNLMNVAVSRAQHRLYVIGHRDPWKTFAALLGARRAPALA